MNAFADPFKSARPQPMTVKIAIAVRMTGIGRSKLYELIKAGEIETVKIGSARLVIVDSLRQLIEKHRVPSQ
jgi:excisionase family DNA binding protein